MKTSHYPFIKIAILLFAPSLVALADDPARLKEAKLIIEHNATDHDTGFQGAIDSEGWRKLDITGPNGLVLSFEGKGALGTLGVTELFFETVEPGNAHLSVQDLLAKLPAGNYEMKGQRMENGRSEGEVNGAAVLTHTIPAGPELFAPAEHATINASDEVTMKWGTVTKTITGAPVQIIAYQLIVEKDEAPHPRMIGKFALNVRFPATVTSMELPDGFLQADTNYKWEVLAVEQGGNQTLSSSGFNTRGKRGTKAMAKEKADEQDEDEKTDEKPAGK